MPRAEARNSVITSRRTNGSPPVMRILRVPEPNEGGAEPVELLQRQQFGLRQEVMSSAMQ